MSFNNGRFFAKTAPVFLCQRYQFFIANNRMSNIETGLNKIA